MTQYDNAKEEQVAYAKLLDLGMKIGLILLIITFLFMYWVYFLHIFLFLTCQNIGN